MALYTLFKTLESSFEKNAKILDISFDEFQFHKLNKAL
jgi:hypothetical protein